MFILQDIAIGKALKTLREAKKWSQDKIVAEIQLRGSTMSRSTYAKIESGIRNIKASDFVILKHVLETSYEILLGEESP
jgi:transcriptional regulator with XRE-family HTH domain